MRESNRNLKLEQEQSLCFCAVNQVSVNVEYLPLANMTYDL
jgi:hypothetical protein